MPQVPDRDGVREQLAEALGLSTYNRLIASVPDTWRLGRLRFWQEELLRRASPTGLTIATAEEFLRVFDGASLLPVPSEPWTREVFLCGIQKWPHGGFPLYETPTEWMAAAWEIDRVREELSGAMARTVSKDGGLAYTDEYLRFLSESLPILRQVELYLYILDRCATREPEFRPGFERAFPACLPFLPPPLTHQELLGVLGLTEEEYQRQMTPPAQVSPDSAGLDGGSGEDIPF